MQFTLTFDQSDMALLSLAIAELPEKARLEMIGKINSQIAEQRAAANKTDTGSEERS